MTIRSRLLAKGVWALALTVAIGALFNIALVTDASASARHHHLKPRYEGTNHVTAKVKKPTLPYMEAELVVDEATGAMVVNDNPTDLFNPASNTKLATSLAVLKKFGANYRFTNEVLYSGTIDANGVVQGNLYVTGNYILFGDDQASELKTILRDHGIKSITGDLIVSPDFVMDAENTGVDAGEKLKDLISPDLSANKKATRAQLAARARNRLSVGGQVNIGTAPATATHVATYTSPPLKDILKRMLCPSDNEMAERFGEMIGGPNGLTQFVINEVKVPAAEVQFASTSGLFVNRVSADAMMKVLLALKDQLAKENLTFADIMSVSGIDSGTVHNRLNSGSQRGSVVAKTGTLPDTDSGASALSGEMHTKTGTYMFVLFEMHGDVGTFKGRENSRVTDFQNAHGGPKAIKYTPIQSRFQGEGSWN